MWERRVDAVLGIAASALLLCLMLVTFVDVVARYLFNRPIRGAFEVTELTLLVLIFAGLPLVSHADEHVTMDFIDRMLPARAGSMRSMKSIVTCSSACETSGSPAKISTSKVSSVTS